MSLYFQEWRKKISNFLAAGIKIKPEGVNLSAKENYACLPEFWSGMTPSDQQQVVDVFGKYDNHYSVKLPQELNRYFQIPFSSIHNISVCVLVSKEHPEKVEFGHGTSVMSADTAVGDSADPDIEADAANIDIHKGLNSFQIVPKLMTCGTSTDMDLFSHMIMHRNRNFNVS